jgi:hypothetical protein
MSPRSVPPLGPIAALVLFAGTLGCGKVGAGDGPDAHAGGAPADAATRVPFGEERPRDPLDSDAVREDAGPERAMPEDEADADAADIAAAAGADDPALAARLALIVLDYRNWTPRPAPQAATSPFGPGASRAPAPPTTPGFGGPRPHVSRAAASAVAPELGPTHAEQLFFVYARNPAAYRGVGSEASQRDQVVVLETRAAVPFVMPGPGRAPNDVVTLGGQAVQPGATERLFVMMHDLTDESGESHWTYGVVLPDGTVVQAGRIASCIVCHADAPHGGLFGVR